jgi:signal transduction histidine kinase
MRSRLRLAGDVALVVLAVIVDLVVWGGEGQLRTGATLPFWVVPALTIVVFSTLLVRWRHPIAIFWVQWTYALAGLVVPGYEPFAGLLVALYAVASRTRPLVAWTAIIACVIPIAIDAYNAMGGLNGGVVAEFETFATEAMLLAVLSGTVWALGRLSYAARRLADKQRELQAAEGEAAVRAERLRLARELHDVVAHAVSAMILQAAGARTLVHPRDDRVRQSLEVIETAGVQAMAELHRLLGLLRSVDPASADDVYEHQPTLKDLPALIDLSRASGLAIDLVTEGETAELDPSVDLAAYRIIQEALTNTAKHAGLGAATRIHLRWHPDGLTITARDTAGLDRPGRGRAGPLSSGHGLTGLAERVNLTGGQFESGAVDGGFLIRAELPLSAARRPAAVHGTSTQDDQ